MHQDKINLPYFAVLKFLTQPAVGLRVLGEKDKAAGAAIKTMHHIHLPAQVLFQLVDQRHGVLDAASRDDELPRRLGESDEGLVFIKDLYGHGKRICNINARAMADQDDIPGISDEQPSRQRPLGIIAAIVTFIVFIALGYWITQQKKSDQVREQVLSALDKELTADEEALKAQREKLGELTQRVEARRAAIEMGEYKSGKAAVAEFNKLAAEQRAEREKFTKMAEEYNKKVAEYRKLEQ